MSPRNFLASMLMTLALAFGGGPLYADNSSPADNTSPVEMAKQVCEHKLYKEEKVVKRLAEYGITDFALAQIEASCTGAVDHAWYDCVGSSFCMAYHAF